MYTEDDTFRILKRTPVIEMGKLYRVWFRTYGMRRWDSENRRKFFQSHGWTISEFLAEHTRVVGKIIHD